MVCEKNLSRGCGLVRAGSQAFFAWVGFLRSEGPAFAVTRNNNQEKSESPTLYSSSAFQSVGGNEMCQNPGAAVSNSTGTKNPP